MLDYAAAHQEATLTYHASDMVLWCESDASYLSAPKARSRSGGLFFLSSKPCGNPPENPKLNGIILAHAKIINNVMASAMEAEVGATYINAIEIVAIRNTLTELGHPQPPTPIKVDSQTAEGFANDTIKFKRSKVIDMRFHWIKDRSNRHQFTVYWRPSAENRAE